MMMILNEEKYARDLLTGQRDDIKSIRKKIELLTRYNYHVLHKSDEDNYSSTVKWLEKHHGIFSEQSYSNIISNYIKRASKKPFYNIDYIKITKNEMDIIKSQNNLRYEKILFVLLCMAKMQKHSYEFDNGLVSYNLTELFKMARVSVPVDEREKILHYFYSEKLIGLPFKNDSKCLFVKFVDNSEEDIVLELSEQDCCELAYSYLKFTDKGKITRCAKCGKLIKQSKKFGELCKGCQESSTNMRIGWCIDCGNEFQVDSRNTTKCRCEECQKLYRTDYMREFMKKKRKSI